VTLCESEAILKKGFSNGKKRCNSQTVVNLDTVTFGVEIECALPKSYYFERSIQIGIYHHGVQLPDGPSPLIAGETL